ncbi:hypothetical protein [Deinococcus hohokamensis]|uniref:Uncharacterized protein n=1 Tax=Deinococcus hohokamensis TaxID=309883 RepID=A0ABV9I5V3_9DEIO
MPIALTDLQRRAQTQPTATRDQATEINEILGVPCVHVGGERYLPLHTAVRRCGVDDTLVFAEDPRSLLTWRKYETTVHVLLLGVSLLLGLHGHEYAALREAAGPLAYARALNVGEHSSPLARCVAAVSQDLEDFTRQGAAGAAVTPAQMGRLLELALLSQALIEEASHTGQTPQRLRDPVAELLEAPDAFLATALRAVP